MADQSIGTNFVGRSVLVVGAGGIGAQACRQITRAGGRLFFTYHQNAARAKELAGDLHGLGDLAGYAPLEVSDPEAVVTAVARAEQAMGRIDALISTAGYLHELVLFQDMSLEEIQQTLAVELNGVIYLLKAALPGMLDRGYGRVVVIGSDSGKVGSKAEAISAAARGGVIALAKSVAREVAARDICVNVVCPGVIDTPLSRSMTSEGDMTGSLVEALIRAIPKRRIGRPEEVAGLATFLASEQAGYITGQAISVSGGLTMC